MENKIGDTDTMRELKSNDYLEENGTSTNEE